MFKCFKKFELVQIPREENEHVDAKLASLKDALLFKIVSIELLPKPSIDQKGRRSYGYKIKLRGCKKLFPIWEMKYFLMIKRQHKKLRIRVARYTLQGDILFKPWCTLPLLRYISGDDVSYIIKEIHENVYGNHISGHSLSQKGLEAGILLA